MNQKSIIMEKSKVEIMEDILAKLENIKNSQESLIEKVGYIQVELFNHPDSELENQLSQINTKASELYEFMDQVIEDYTMKLNNEKLQHQ